MEWCPEETDGFVPKHPFVPEFNEKTGVIFVNFAGNKNIKGLFTRGDFDLTISRSDLIMFQDKYITGFSN